MTTIPKPHYAYIYLRFTASACKSATTRRHTHLLKLGKISRGLLAVLGWVATKLVLDLQKLDCVGLHFGVRPGRKLGGSPVSRNIGLRIRLILSDVEAECVDSQGQRPTSEPRHPASGG